jgi:hypothetical protein
MCLKVERLRADPDPVLAEAAWWASARLAPGETATTPDNAQL